MCKSKIMLFEPENISRKFKCNPLGRGGEILINTDHLLHPVA